MRPLHVLLGAATLLAQPILAQQEEVRNPRTSSEDAAAGAKTFRSHCSACHGMNAEGGRGPNLAAGRFFRGSSDAELLRNISEGIEGTEMPGLFYSPDRVWQIVAYLRSLNSSAKPPGGDRARGEKLFQAHGCAKCHRYHGEGGRMGPDLTNVGRSRSSDHLRRSLEEPNADVRQRYWVVNATGTNGKQYMGFLMNEDTYTVQFIDMGERLQTLNKADLQSYEVLKKSMMPSYKGKLSDAELDDLVSFLKSEASK